MKYFVKNLFRSARKNLGTYIGATLIMALGIFIFVSMNDTFLNLKNQVYRYYEENNMADIFAEVISMPKEKLKDFEDIPGIREASGLLSADLRVSSESIKDIANLHVFAYDEDSTLNKLLLKPETVPEGDQIFIGEKMMKARGLNKGDMISLINNGESYDFVIAGAASAPNYIYSIPPSGAMLSDGTDYDIAIISSKQLTGILGREDTVNEISFKMENSYSYEKLRYVLNERLKEYGLKSLTNKEKQNSYNMVEGELTELTGTGTILPVIFMAMSVFMLYTVLKKMIDNDRSLIGTMKAMGLKNTELIGAYLFQAIIISFLGALIGCILARPFGKYMFDQYASVFSLPSPTYLDFLSTKVQGFLIAGGASIAAVIFGVGGIVKIHAAEAMRAASPNVKYNFNLVDAIIKKLKVMQKMGIRSILRSPFRTFFIAFAIAFPFSLSCNLMAAQDAVNQMFIGYFNDVAKYDVKVTIKDYVPVNSAMNSLENIEGIGERETICEVPVVLKSRNHSKIAMLTGMNRGSNLYKISDVDNVFYEPPKNGIILNARIAKDLNVAEGDKVEISTSYYPHQKSLVPITKVISEAFGSGCYMDIESINNYLPVGDFTNTMIFNTHREDDIRKMLTEKSSEITAFTSRKDTLRVYESRMASSRFMLQMFIYLTLFSGVVLIYNISLISIRERKTEFATMKIMGISDVELKQMVFTEQAVYLMTGLVLSVPMVNFFKWILEVLMVSDSYTLKLHINLPIYIVSFLFCVLMLYISARGILRTIKKINPNDSLKERG